MGRTRTIQPSLRAAAHRRPLAIALALAIAVAVCALAASSASARGLKLGLTDDDVFNADSASVRAQWLDRAVASKSRIIRVTVNWRASVRASSPPAKPTSPADPAYHFSHLDATIRSARSRGLDVMLTVYNAPQWAQDGTPPKGINPGSWKPDPHRFGQFGQALARRYSGHFRNLPKVPYFEVWTEPNLTQFLAPQWSGKKKFAPKRYRKLLNEFYDGVHAAQPGATVIGGAVAPFGDPRKHPLNPSRPRIRPITFLRSMLCLGHAKCKKTRLDALSAHPLNGTQAPSYHPHNKNDIQVATFRRVRKVMKDARRAHTVPRGRHPLWATEIGFFSDPPNPLGAPIQQHARWLEQSLYMLWKQGASVVLNLQIRDPEYHPRGNPKAQYTTGLFFHDGRAKPAFDAWRFPFVTHRKNKRTVSAWGRSPGSGTLKIQRQKHGKWNTIKSLKVHGGSVFRTKLRVRGQAKLRAQLGSLHSISWQQRG